MRLKDGSLVKHFLSSTSLIVTASLDISINWIVQWKSYVPKECKLLTFRVNNYLKFQLKSLMYTPYFFKLFKLRRRLTSFSEYFNISSLFMPWWFKVFFALHFFLSSQIVWTLGNRHFPMLRVRKMSLNSEASASIEAVGLKCELRNNYRSCCTDFSNIWMACCNKLKTICWCSVSVSFLCFLK